MLVASVKELRKNLPPKSRLLGMDHSKSALGLALSNPELSISTPFRTLKGNKFTENMAALAAICEEYTVRGFVIGLPYNMDGTEGKRAESVRSFAGNLLKSKNILGFEPVILFIDERLSTHQAEQFLFEQSGVKRKKRSEVVDNLAASHILQGALDALQKEA